MEDIGSHSHGLTLFSSQVVVPSAPVYVVAAESGKAFVIPAIRFMDVQMPRPEHSKEVSEGHFNFWQASPAKPSKHWHLPVNDVSISNAH